MCSKEMNTESDIYCWLRRRGYSLLIPLLWLSMLVSACTSDDAARAPAGGEKRGLVVAAEGLPSGDLWRHDFAFADMNGDGELDLITAPPRKSKKPWPRIFLRQKEQWEAVSCPDAAQDGFPAQEYVYGGVTVADVTGDGKMEIAIAMHEIGMRLFHNTGTGPCGPWEEVKDIPPQAHSLRSRAIVHGDMNRDGRTDLVLLSEAPGMNASDRVAGLVILWNEVSGWRFENIDGSAGLFGDDVALGEVNGDGVPDIAVGSLRDSRPDFLWLSDGQGKWSAAGREGLPNNILAWTVQLVDVDNDGKDELLLGVGGAPVYKNGGPRLYRWDGARWHDLSQGLPQVFWVAGVTAVDIDGDKRKEIVAAAMYTGVVKVYGQQADKSWVERQELQATGPEKLRNYKVRSFSAGKVKQNIVVANYAGESDGKITAWAWR